MVTKSKQVKKSLVKNEKLSRSIEEMAVEDQKLRAKLQALFKKHDSKDIKKFQLKILEVDKKHTGRLKKIIKKYGWPTISFVGKNSSNLAWLLTQHASHDLDFQQQCLVLIKKVLKRKDVSPKNFAYLSDRIRVAKNLPQFFGTQFRRDDNGNMMPYPIYNPKEVNRRRKKYGLIPLKKKDVTKYLEHAVKKITK